MRKEVKIALCAVLALVVLFVGMNFLKGIRVFSHAERYYIEIEDITGVNKNCAIYAEGVQIGTVRQIEYDYTHAEPTKLLCAINEDMVLPEGTTAEVTSDLMGNVAVVLTLGEYSNARIPAGGIIYGAPEDGTIAKLKRMVPTIEAMGPKVDSILVSINAILSDPALAQTISNIGELTERLNALAVSTQQLTKNLNAEVPELSDKANELLDKLNELDVEQMNATVANAYEAICECRETMNRLEEGANEAMSSLDNTLNNADSLLIDVKQNPKRYINVSVFGRK